MMSSNKEACSNTRRLFGFKSYYFTVKVCRVAYLVQGILNNFLPLLFLRFSIEFGFSFNKISFLIIMNFGVQMVVDYLSAKWVDYFGYRKSVVASQFLSFAGLAGLSVLPFVLTDPYIGILISVFLYAVGSSLIETVASPIVQACPIDNKDAEMTLLHSNYCWGHVLVVVGSSLFFGIFGIQYWRALSCIWALVPLVTMFLFFKVPMCSLADERKNVSGRNLIKMPVFWMLIVLMFCAGAAEQGISQWISTFAEAGLGINKTLGDLAGTCMFAVLMGSSRLLYGKFNNILNLEKFMMFSAVLCFICYAGAALAVSPVASLIACVACGTTVGIMWPGIYSLSTDKITNGGTGLFAYLALAGDMGCAGGPGVIGFISDACGGILKTGILFSAIFPAVFVVVLKMLLARKK